MATIDRWRVHVKFQNNNPSTRREVLRRANREPSIATGGQFDSVPGELDEMKWFLDTKGEGDKLAKAFDDISDVTVISEPNFGRFLKDGELEPTMTALLAGKHLCIGCGTPLDPSQPQVAAIAWMLGVGSTTQYQCLVCPTKNDLTIISEAAATV